MPATKISSAKTSASKTRLYWRLQLAAHFLQKRADQELAAKGDITIAQTGVLAVIANRGEVTQKDVATTLGLNESAVTAMVKRLEKLGLVQRTRSETDGRAWNLSLTEDGKAVQKTTRPPFRKINAKIEETLSEDEIEALADYLTRLTDAFR